MRSKLRVYSHGERKLIRGECTTGQRLPKHHGGQFPLSLLLSCSYQGTSIPARENCPSIAPILSANHSGPTSERVR
jgi:hypothetical protein